MCGCSSSTSTTALLPAPCDDPTAPGLERTRFYPRMLVGPADLTQDQIYFREKMRRHNRMLHGWGVVCGLEVSPVPGQKENEICQVQVFPGDAIGPYGDEIVVPQMVILDICKMGGTEVLGCCPDDYDPWCTDTRSTCSEGIRYLAIRYAECMATPVRSSGGGCGCGCDESGCEYSRIRDGYAFKLLSTLPDSYRNRWTLPTDPCASGVRPCPPCPKDPWVIISTVSISAKCTGTDIDCVNNRRYVVTHAGSPIVCGTLGPIGPWKPPGLWPGFKLPLALLDLAMVDRNEEPEALIRMKSATGEAVMVPLSRELIPDATMSVAKLLDRHGDRKFYDPALESSFTLRELFESSGVPDTASVRGLSGVLGVLEDRTYRIGAVEAVRGDLRTLIGDAGTTRLNEDRLGLHES